MKVMKFGGTSVGSVNSILNVKKIVEAEKEPVIVVVSALGGITDLLISTSKLASVGNIEYEAGLKNIVNRHYEMINQVIPEGKYKKQLLDVVGDLLRELKDIYQGMYF